MYPKALYQGARFKQWGELHALFNGGTMKTAVAKDEAHETELRSQGWTDITDLMDDLEVKIPRKRGRPRKDEQ